MEMLSSLFDLLVSGLVIIAFGTPVWVLTKEKKWLGLGVLIIVYILGYYNI
tara:strand:+ start:136 stop:288 length:153 start_codon:yes stop_codon:yes gene_type:complete